MECKIDGVCIDVALTCSHQLADDDLLEERYLLKNASRHSCVCENTNDERRAYVQKRLWGKNNTSVVNIMDFLFCNIGFSLMSPQISTFVLAVIIVHIVQLCIIGTHTAISSMFVLILKFTFSKIHIVHTRMRAVAVQCCLVELQCCTMCACVGMLDRTPHLLSKTWEFVDC